MIRNTEEFLAALRTARRASTPLVSIRTADPASANALPFIGWCPAFSRRVMLLMPTSPDNGCLRNRDWAALLALNGTN